MKTQILNILIIVVIIAFISCSEKSNEFFDPSYWSGPYQGITFTDQYGMQLKVDTDDWCIGQSISDNSSTIIPTVESYAFIPAFPNPVNRENESITFRFYIAKDSNIKIEINNNKIITVKTITNGIFARGVHEIEWDLTDTQGNKVPAGIYRCYMTSDDFSCYGDVWIK